MTSARSSMALPTIAATNTASTRIRMIAISVALGSDVLKGLCQIEPSRVASDPGGISPA